MGRIRRQRQKTGPNRPAVNPTVAPGPHCGNWAQRNLHKKDAGTACHPRHRPAFPTRPATAVPPPGHLICSRRSYQDDHKDVAVSEAPTNESLGTVPSRCRGLVPASWRLADGARFPMRGQDGVNRVPDRSFRVFSAATCDGMAPHSAILSQSGTPGIVPIGRRW